MADCSEYGIPWDPTTESLVLTGDDEVLRRLNELESGIDFAGDFLALVASLRAEGREVEAAPGWFMLEVDGTRFKTMVDHDQQVRWRMQTGE